MSRRSEKAWLSWSSGKDSAWALDSARRQEGIEVIGLVTTVTEPFARVSMHGVRCELLEAQAQAVGLPLQRVFIPSPCPNGIYEAALRAALEQARSQGVGTVIFGDIFLADVRAYREAQLSRVGLHASFPLWMRSTRSLAQEMIAAGLRARVTCLDPKRVPARWAGAVFDRAFLAGLPSGVDPCGENGEFHTFAYDGPMFANPISIEVGPSVEREGLRFTDLALSPA